MSHKYLSESANKKKTPQNEPIPGSNQIKNNAGGFAWEATKWDRLNRWLILGSEGGTYYIGEKKLTKDNAKSVLECLNEDPIRTIDTIVQVSDSGRSSDNDIALFCLALAASHENLDVRRYALDNLPRVARIGTHLFHFIEFTKNNRGWGRSLRTAIKNWYNTKDADNLAFLMAKYQQRDGWANKDLLKLSHPTPKTPQHELLYQWATEKGTVRIEKDKVFYDYSISDKRVGKSKEGSGELFGLIRTYELLKACKSEKEVINIMKNNLTQREIIPTEYLNSKEVWRLLYPHLKTMALVRNLNTLSRVGIISQGNFNDIQNITSKLLDPKLLKESRIHPLNILFALRTYQQGRGMRGTSTWPVTPQIVDTLDKMFYKAFDNVEPTGKRLYLGVDVSRSMDSSKIRDSFLTAREGACALAMATMKTEQNYIIKGFTEGHSRSIKKGYGSKWSGYGGGSNSSSEMVPLNINASMDLNSVINVAKAIPFGGTNCALPMLDAIENDYQVDAFIVYTDSETWFGDIHPMQALQEYRRKSGINAKLIIVGMVSNSVSIADPKDKNSLDVVGFDASLPTLIQDFLTDKI